MVAQLHPEPAVDADWRRLAEEALQASPCPGKRESSGFFSRSKVANGVKNGLLEAVCNTDQLGAATEALRAAQIGSRQQPGDGLLDLLPSASLPEITELRSIYATLTGAERLFSRTCEHIRLTAHEHKTKKGAVTSSEIFADIATHAETATSVTAARVTKTSRIKENAVSCTEMEAIDIERSPSLHSQSRGAFIEHANNENESSNSCIQGTPSLKPFSSRTKKGKGKQKDRPTEYSKQQVQSSENFTSEYFGNEMSLYGTMSDVEPCSRSRLAHVDKNLLQIRSKARAGSCKRSLTASDDAGPSSVHLPQQNLLSAAASSAVLLPSAKEATRQTLSHESQPAMARKMVPKDAHLTTIRRPKLKAESTAALCHPDHLESGTVSPQAIRDHHYIAQRSEGDPGSQQLQQGDAHPHMRGDEEIIDKSCVQSTNEVMEQIFFAWLFCRLVKARQVKESSASGLRRSRGRLQTTREIGEKNLLNMYNDGSQASLQMISEAQRQCSL